MPTALQPTVSPSPSAKLGDFPDFLGPMLVKELRQGVRERGFILALVTSQILLALTIIPASLARTLQQSGEIIESALFGAAFLLLLVIQPLRGFNAIASEQKAGNLDLLQITRLSSGGIVYGKWLSLVGQSLLFAVTLTPYFALRYLFGGMNLADTLLISTSLLFASALLTAITLAISTAPSLIARGLALGALGTIAAILIDELERALPTSFGSNLWAVIPFLSLTTYATYAALEIAATTIAHNSENRDTRKRIVTLAVIPCLFLPGIIASEPLPWAMVMSFVYLAAILNVSTKQTLVPTTARPSVLRNRTGPFFRVFLYPGWGSGFLFHLSLTILLIGIVALTPRSDFSEILHLLVSAGVVSTAALLTINLAKFARQRSAFFAAFLVPPTLSHVLIEEPVLVITLLLLALNLFFIVLAILFALRQTHHYPQIELVARTAFSRPHA